ncbi:hypothetical protein [Rhizobium tumorigenes]|uniref:hypothetical protein n=1 Tax=Rhizobium tumorigenes TaxID=2041385 RepID=UPI001F0ACF32
MKRMVVTAAIFASFAPSSLSAIQNQHLGRFDLVDPANRLGMLAYPLHLAGQGAASTKRLTLLAHAAFESGIVPAYVGFDAT